MALLKILQIPCYDVNSKPQENTCLWIEAKTPYDRDHDVICLQVVYSRGRYYPLSLKGTLADEPIPMHHIISWCHYPNTLVKH